MPLNYIHINGCTFRSRCPKNYLHKSFVFLLSKYALPRNKKITFTCTIHSTLTICFKTTILLLILCCSFLLHHHTYRQIELFNTIVSIDRDRKRRSPFVIVSNFPSLRTVRFSVFSCSGHEGIASSFAGYRRSDSIFSLSSLLPFSFLRSFDHFPPSALPRT